MSPTQTDQPIKPPRLAKSGKAVPTVDLPAMAPANQEIDGYRLAVRMIFPANGDTDIMPLYIDKKLRNESQRSRARVLGRHALCVPSGESVSLGSYFNAFPVSYWRRWTMVETVRLDLMVSGAGAVVVKRSNARGDRQRVVSREFDGVNQRLKIDLPIKAFADGGWYWIDIEAGDREVVVANAGWYVPAGDRPHSRITIATTTYNKPDWITRNLQKMHRDPDLMAVIDEVIVVDQGTDQVRDDPDYQAVVDQFGDQFSLIEQPNLGGSGGFSRGMFETVVRGKSNYVLFLDDDINLEPESIIRMVTFADMCSHPTIVGGHMFDLMNRSVLHTFGEHIDPWNWQPAPVGVGSEYRHDFAKAGLRGTRWLHQRIDAGYNGWWMCLIPVSVVKQIGLSLPVFIKWDDMEYGMRASAAGFATVSLPGAALWHISWVDKDDSVDWQAYFHERNRLIAGLLHSRFPRGGDLLRNSEFIDLKHIVSMQYYAAAERALAQADVLAGPDQLHDILASRNADVRAMAKQYQDSQYRNRYEDFPAIRDKRPKKTKPARGRAGSGGAASGPSRVQGLLGAAKALLRQALPPTAGYTKNPQAQVFHKDNQWWNLARWDSALVTNAEGTGMAWYVRQPKESKRMMLTSALNHARILRDWVGLRQLYRAQLAEVTSMQSWAKTFGVDYPQD